MFTMFTTFTTFTTFMSFASIKKLFNCQRSNPIALTPRTPKPGLRGDPGAAWADRQRIFGPRAGGKSSALHCYRTLSSHVNRPGKNIFLDQEPNRQHHNGHLFSSTYGRIDQGLKLSPLSDSTLDISLDQFLQGSSSKKLSCAPIRYGCSSFEAG